MDGLCSKRNFSSTSMKTISLCLWVFIGCVMADTFKDWGHDFYYRSPGKKSAIELEKKLNPESDCKRCIYTRDRYSCSACYNKGNLVPFYGASKRGSSTPYYGGWKRSDTVPYYGGFKRSYIVPYYDGLKRVDTVPFYAGFKRRDFSPYYDGWKRGTIVPYYGGFKRSETEYPLQHENSVADKEKRAYFLSCYCCVAFSEPICCRNCGPQAYYGKRSFETETSTAELESETKECECCEKGSFDFHCCITQCKNQKRK